MNRSILLLLCLVTLSTSLSAQSWRKLRNQAEELEEQGDFYGAAETYRQAWDARPGKEELIYAAAENYMRVRDYRAAAEAYQFLQTGSNNYPLVGLKYGRALKQDGQYDKARNALTRALDDYNGPDRAILEEIVRKEIAGIDLARNNAGRVDTRLQLSRPGPEINSEANELSPAPISPEVLYFTSGMGGQNRIYQSMRSGSGWTKAVNPPGFPVIQNGQYSGGSISPDGQRFYFTICSTETAGGRMVSRCEIYVTRRTGTGWGAPEALPEVINRQGATTTHPFVVHVAGQEYLFFSSNRENGRGGMDIWYTIRDLGLDKNDFAFPVNLGPVINTLGDEITPFYDIDQRALFFSSNGHPSLGGQDIFSSKGEEVNWAMPVNLGVPLNSSADDFGYTLDRLGFGNGFLVSNRPFGGVKNNTRDTDIYEFSIGGNQITLRANVYDQSAGALLDNVKVNLFEIFDTGAENLLVSKNFPAGSYLFEVIPNRRYRVEVVRDGYMPGSYTFSTNDPNTQTYGQPLFLEVARNYTQPQGTVDQPTTYNAPGQNYPSTYGQNQQPRTGQPNTQPTYTPPTPPSTSQPTRPVYTPPADNSGGVIRPVNPGAANPPPATNQPTPYSQRGNDQQEYISQADRLTGTYYKIQVAAVRNFSPSDPKYQSLTALGSLETEALPDRNLNRVLVANFFTPAEARTALQRARAMGFESAYVVQYDNGVRGRRVNF